MTIFQLSNQEYVAKEGDDYFHGLPIGYIVPWSGRIQFLGDGIHSHWIVATICIGDYIIYKWTIGCKGQIEFENRYEEGHPMSKITETFIESRMATDLIHALLPKSN